MTGREWRRRALAVFFPERCAYCGRVTPPCRPACVECLPRLARINPPICRLCGRGEDSCSCEGHRRHFERVAAPFYYEDRAKEGIGRLKSGHPEAALSLAEEMAAVVKREYPRVAFDMLTAVPMWAADRKARGYNQSELLAEELSRALGIPSVRTLRKIQETAPQKALSALERSGNLLGAFDLAEGARVEGKTVLLIDDIVTTGATLDECAKMLKIYGAEEVFAVTATASRLSKQNK